MLTVLHTESSEGWGGQEIRVVAESLGMMKRGYMVLLAASERGKIFGRAREAGIGVFPVHFDKKNPLCIKKTLSIINGERVDIVNTHSSSDSWVAGIAARLSSSRPGVIRTRHLSTPIRRSYLSRLLYNVLPDAVITTGEEIRQRMINDNGFDAAKIFSIPTGVDTERFNPSRARPAFRVGGFTAGMVGVLRSWKGHRYFIEAVPGISWRIPGALFYIVGDGPQRENIKKMIGDLSLGDRVIMAGHREDIPEVMASLDVVVQPSYASEGVPQSILQAMAMGKPVVASDTGAIKEVVVDGVSGFLVEPRNPGMLAEKVIELYENPGLRMEFGKNGRRLVEERYSFDDMLDKVESLYGKILSRRPV